jgi:hypothetical protein
MKKLRQICATLTLTLALTFPASAGDIGFPGITSQTPQQASVTSDMSTPSTPVTGEIPGPDAAEFDPVAEAVLSLLQGLLSLF